MATPGKRTHVTTVGGTTTKPPVTWQPTAQPLVGYVPQAQTPASVPPTVCTICGKPIAKPGTLQAGMGHRCAMVQAAQGKSFYLYAQPPTTHTLTVAKLHTIINAHKAQVPGLSVAKMVKAIGTDKGLQPPVHPVCQVYFMGQRFVHNWLGTMAGLQAIATNNYSNAPK